VQATCIVCISPELEAQWLLKDLMAKLFVSSTTFWVQPTCGGYTVRGIRPTCKSSLQPSSYHRYSTRFRKLDVTQRKLPSWGLVVVQMEMPGRCRCINEHGNMVRARFLDSRFRIGGYAALAEMLMQIQGPDCVAACNIHVAGRLNLPPLRNVLPRCIVVPDGSAQLVKSRLLARILYDSMRSCWHRCDGMWAGLKKRSATVLPRSWFLTREIL